VSVGILSAFFVVAQAQYLTPPSKVSELSELYARRIFTRFSIEQGLSQNTVQAITQDKQGFLWFGTQDGLCRYDGYSFLTFRAKKNDSTSLAVSAISALMVDSKGTLWVGTEGGGLSRYNAHNRSFTTFRHDPQNPSSLADDVIESLCEDAQGTLWIGTEHGGLNRFNPQKNTFSAFKHDPANARTIGANRVYNVVQGQNGTLWVSTYGGGLNSFDPKTGVFTRFQHDSSNSNSLSNDFVYSIVQDQQGILWVATYGGGLNTFNPATGQWKCFTHHPNNPASMSHNQLRALALDARGKLWVGTDGAGVYVFDRTTEQFQRLQARPSDPITLSGNFIRSFFCDASGVMWVGTNVAGICCSAPTAHKFALFRKEEPAGAASLSDNVVRYLHEGIDGTLWVGTNNGGLNAMNRSTGEFHVWRRDSLKNNKLSNGTVWTIANAPNGMLWVGTHEGLNLFHPRSETFEVLLHKPNDSSSLTTNLVRALQPAQDGSLWVGLINNGGLCRLNPATKKCVRYLHDPKNPRSLGSNYVRALLETRGGRLWVGTWSGGLCRFDPVSNDFTVFKSTTHNPRGLRSNVIRVLFEDRAGTVWAGTPEGLHRLDDSEKGVFTCFTTEDGLPNNVIYSIQEDNSGNLWLGTNNGLCRFHPRTKQCRSYTVADGLQSNEFNGLASCRTHDGMMYFGGVEGFNGFHPDSVRDNPFAPPVVLTDLTLYNVRAALDTAIELAHTVTVRHEDNVTIAFAALEYSRPAANRFTYILQGLDKRWTEAGTRHEATYTNLPPGEYVFCVRAANSDGVWNNEGRKLHLVVLPPWWMTWWFRSLCVLALCGLIAGGYRWRVAYLLKRANELQRVIDEQTFELRDTNAELQILNRDLVQRNEELAAFNAEKNEFLGIVSHDLKNPIGVILGLAELIESNDLDEREVRSLMSQIIRSSERMLELVKNLLDINRLETGGMAMHLMSLNLAPLVEASTEQFFSLAEAKNIKLEWRNDAYSSIVNGDEQALVQVLENLISNAIKYSPQGKNVWVRLTSSTEAVRVEITDEGPGISELDMKRMFGKFARLSAKPTGGEHSTGLGLSIVKKLVEAMNGRVWCESELGKGATFVVELPRAG
jgi:signal transduction histidine kinase/ligand-binding sensor domain-containing protein